jgi:hypothetical protein
MRKSKQQSNQLADMQQQLYDIKACGEDNQKYLKHISPIIGLLYDKSKPGGLSVSDIREYIERRLKFFAETLRNVDGSVDMGRLHQYHLCKEILEFIDNVKSADLQNNTEENNHAK